MSQWTHVAGIIRLDSIGATLLRGNKDEITRQVKEAAEKILGYTVKFDSPAEQPCTVPTGSEGSLQYEVVHTGGDGELAWGHVAIWGDLRDFGEEDVPKITKWFEESLLKMKPRPGTQFANKIDQVVAAFSIRDAVLSVNVEYGLKRILTWDNVAQKLLCR